MLFCPDCNDNTEARIRDWKKNVEEYISAQPFQELLEVFGYHGEDGSLEQKLSRIRSFVSSRWDYRSKAGGGERWTVMDNDPSAFQNKDKILRCARQLGMIDRIETGQSCDYILPLGGARAANMDRVMEARRIADEQSREASVVALTAMRRIAELEVPFVKDYVDPVVLGKTTEFDVMCGAMAKVFSLKLQSEEGQVCRNEPNRSWKIRKYDHAAVISAPSSDPAKRRANTADTLEFFLQKYSVPAGSVLHFTTSSIYINYQTALLIPIALKYNLKFLFSGQCSKGHDRGKVVSNYLQEIKGSIDSICRSLEFPG